jgi:hypothetical protein
MSKKLTLNQVNEKIFEKCNKLNYEFLKFENEKWINAKSTKLILKCNKDGYIYIWKRTL